MTYDARERSLFEAYPVELYLFARGAQYWRYTSADEDKVVDGVTYNSVQIKRGAFEQNQEMSRSNLTLTMDKGISFLDQFRGSPPTDIVQLTIQRYHEGDAQLAVPWVGRVVNVKFLERKAEVWLEPVFTSLRRPTLRRMYQTTCPHVLYGAACGKSSADFRVDATLTGVSGRDLLSPAFSSFADGYFAGGYVDWEVAEVLERRFIIAHVGQTITLNLPLAGIPANATVRAYPGCDHTLNTCHNKFNNVDNYGGQPFYPKKNPMNGTPIF